MIVLDTHALIWWVGGIKRLSKQAGQLVEEEKKRGEVMISVISVWEAAILIKKGKLKLTMNLTEWVESLEKSFYVKIMPIDSWIAIESVNLPGEFHKDPADRMIVATARQLGAKLVSKDKKILNYKHVQAVW